ncbi:SMP-30/gluconolactonase/LRE family protein [Nocardia vermiculata]|uniref:SMP-30/gluconolactonase/LRE family protein n=1 Tax=Nocardia vermiculata TaxID=257274 RepID=A0A846Y0C8_9NOCA|nr:SMP-30/gluconolactonase/LRE family protein [Nocardia vermiculata]NKY51542.1 SMP-30/gluconolactonase/LRE family protein [Nocardia vermiculata]
MTAHSPAGYVAEGFSFTECPRYRDGRLWFVDMHLNRVVSVRADGSDRRTLEVASSPGGIGWLPDGRLLVVLMQERKIVRLEGNEFVVHADLSDVVATTLNDLAVDSTGRCYVGETGFDPHIFFTTAEDIEKVCRAEIVPPATSRIFSIEPDGEYREVASGLAFSNGIVVDETRKYLFVAESFGARLSRFDLGAGGDLSGRKELPFDFAPDGIGMDRWGSVWVSDVFGCAAVRFDAEGSEIERLRFDQLVLACAAGGEHGNQLYLCASPSLDSAECLRLRASRIEVRTIAAPAPHAR